MCPVRAPHAVTTTAAGSRTRARVPHDARSGVGGAVGTGSTSSMVRLAGRGPRDRSGPNRANSTYPTIANNGNAYTVSR